MNIVYLGIGIVFVLVLLVFVVRVLRSKSDHAYLGVDHCGSVCPNSGACDGCDVGFP